MIKFGVHCNSNMKTFLLALKPFFLLVIFVMSFGLTAEGQTPEATPAEKVIIGYDVKVGKAKSLPKPVYPESARNAGIAGEVKIEVLIDQTGKVIEAKAVGGVEDLALRQASEAAALQAEFSPTPLSGEPVKVRGVITYNFVAPENEANLEEKVKFLTLSMFLTVAKSFAYWPELLKGAFEGDDLLAELPLEMPEFATELREVKHFDKLTPAKRITAIDTALSAIRQKVGEADRWQMDVGVPFGELMGPVMLLMESGADPSSVRNLDEAKVKGYLAKIATLSAKPPADFPKEVHHRLVALGELADRENLFSDENLMVFGERIYALGNTISPDEN